MLDGTFSLTVGGIAVEASTGTIVRLPAGIPHAVEALTPFAYVVHHVAGRALTRHLCGMRRRGVSW